MSNNNITSIERSIASEVFTFGRKEGITLAGSGERIAYSIGAFKNGNDSSGDLEGAVTGRITYAPYLDNGKVVNFGLGFSERDNGSEGSFPLGSNKGDKIDLLHPAITTEDTSIINIEAASVMGPFHFTAEYFTAEFYGEIESEADGYWIQFATFLTGESRAYRQSKGLFGRVKPRDSKKGAWEIYLRSSQVSSEDDMNLSNTDVDSITIGVNWYYNQHVRVSMNFIQIDSSEDIGGEDSGNAFNTRFQLTF